MAKTVEEIEKNVSASFGYVKKDMLMLNDAISDVHDKIQHLSLNHATLLAEIRKLSEQVGKKPSKKVIKKSESKVAKKKAIKKKTAKKKTSAKKSPKKVIKTQEIVYS